MIALETASPGEIKSEGEGWHITAGFAKSPFGKCLIGESPRGICHLSFIEARESAASWASFQKDWPQVTLSRDDAYARKLAKRVFHRSDLLRVLVKGTVFQTRVWKALLNVPRGALVSYGQLAKRVGKPKAARAVGSAVGKNPVAYLIPCHRVVRQNGAIGQYRWGQARKRAIISRERAAGV